ncbi:MAG TPA: hypothetical protein VGH03_22850 [Caulobacteraceae bacterium]|jgi:hypothetical protein
MTGGTTERFSPYQWRETGRDRAARHGHCKLGAKPSMGGRHKADHDGIQREPG